MSDFPLVSVILGTYNQEKYIKKAIESVLSQTYQNLDIVITNNGSTDRSKSIISEYIDNELITVITYETNSFLGKVVNDAINIAKGEYICFLAGDDYYLPEYIETHLNELRVLPNKYGVVYSPNYVYNEITGTMFVEKGLFNKSGQVFNELIDAQITGFIHAFTPFLRKRVFDMVKHDETVFCEGEMIFIRIAEHFEFKYINITPLLVSTDHDNNQGKNYKENSRSFYEQSYRLMSLYPEMKYKIYEIISKMFVRNAWIATRIMDDKRWAFHCLFVAIKHNPLAILNLKVIAVVLLSPFRSSFIDSLLLFKKNKSKRNSLYIDKRYADAD